MQKILDELWYGNICPIEGYYKATKETKELESYISRHRNELLSALVDAQKENPEKRLDCRDEMNGIREREIFTYAFRLGARIVMELLSVDAS